MSKKNNLIVLIALMVLSLGLNAQTESPNQNTSNGQGVVIQKTTVSEITTKIDTTALLMGKPKDNWFWGFSVGIHTFIGNELESSARLNLPAPQIGLRIGKWLTPCVALALNVDGGYSFGQSKNNVYVYQVGDYKSFTFYYYDLYAEVTLDWMDLCGGYNKANRKIYHLQNTLGFGYGWQTGKSTNPNQSRVSNYELSFHFGFNNEFKLKSNNVIFLEPKLMMLKGTWDYSPYSNKMSKFDFMVSISAGMKFNIGGKNKNHHQFERGTSEIEVASLVNEYDSLSVAKSVNDAKNENTIDSLNNVIGGLRENTESAPQQVINTAENKSLNILTIYYRTGSSNIDYSAEVSLENFAEIIKKSSDDRKFCIISSADTPTGTSESNMEVSQNRCNACYNKLVNEFGVNPEKLEMYPLGGIKHFEPDHMNRMTIIVEDDAEIVEILRSLKDNK